MRRVWKFLAHTWHRHSINSVSPKLSKQADQEQEVNQSSMTEFILFGFAPDPSSSPLFFTFFLGFYLLILVSNSLLITLSHQDLSLHTPTYFFISILSLLDVCYTTTTCPRCSCTFSAGRGPSLLLDMWPRCTSSSSLGSPSPGFFPSCPWMGTWPSATLSSTTS